VHAALLAVILSLKFLTAKAVLLMAIAGTLVWFLMGKRRRLALPPPTGMV
jgi:hypothetical protein